MKIEKNTKPYFLKTLLLFSVVLVLCFAQNALAAPGETNSGVDVTNTAQIEYEISGVAQTPEPSNTVTFTVDHKVKPLVARNMAVDPLAIAPGSTDQFLTFSVTDDGNTDPANPMVMQLRAEADGGNTLTMTAGSVGIYQENGTTAGLQTSGADADIDLTSSPFINPVRDTPVTIYIVADAPIGATDGQTAQYHLVATAWDPTATPAGPLTESGANTAGVDVVFADDAIHTFTSDGDYDGMDSFDATYIIATATLNAAKGSAVVADGVNTTAPYFHIPGATVEYTIDVTNNGSANAENVYIVDQIPANTTFDSIQSGTNSNGTVVTFEYSADGTTWLTTAPATVAWIRAVCGSVNTAGGTAQMVYRVTID